MKMKNLLLIAGLSTYLFFHRINYSKAQGIHTPTESSSDYEHIKVKLSSDIDKYIITSRNGTHVKILADYLGITPMMSNMGCSECLFAFHPNNPELEQLATKLDTNKDGTINLEELSSIY